MADPNLLDLARLAIATPDWRWMDGMAAYWVKPSGTVRGRVRAYVDGDGFSWESPRGDFTGAWPMPEGCGECLPDLSDPATVGCLLALVREAWSSPDLRVRRVGQRTLWEVERWDSALVRYVHVADGPSEVDALLRENRGPMLPCGHPVALLVFDSVDGAIYRCPQCARDRADLLAQAGDQP